MEFSARIVWLGIAVVLSGGMTITGHYFHPQRWLMIRIFKPLTTILILVIALLPGTFLTEPYARAIAFGLVFSLAGDVLLTLPDRYFLYGLVAFLLAHACYISAFWPGALAAGFPWAMAVMAAVGASVLGYLWSRLSTVMKAAVAFYVVAIVVMAALAVGRAMGHPSVGSLSAAIGAVLFVLSDGTLAINRFGRPIRGEQALVLVTYFAAQSLIAVSVGTP